MGLASDDLAEIERLLGTADSGPAVVAALRHRFPALTVTQCDASDVDMETPFCAWHDFSLHLVDSADHCWRLTSDATRATGIVVVHQRQRP